MIITDVLSTSVLLFASLSVAAPQRDARTVLNELNGSQRFGNFFTSNNQPSTSNAVAPNAAASGRDAMPPGTSGNPPDNTASTPGTSPRPLTESGTGQVAQNTEDLVFPGLTDSPGVIDPKEGPLTVGTGRTGNVGVISSNAPSLKAPGSLMKRFQPVGSRGFRSGSIFTSNAPPIDMSRYMGKDSKGGVVPVHIGVIQPGDPPLMVSKKLKKRAQILMNPVPSPSRFTGSAQNLGFNQPIRSTASIGRTNLMKGNQPIRSFGTTGRTNLMTVNQPGRSFGTTGRTNLMTVNQPGRSIGSTGRTRHTIGKSRLATNVIGGGGGGGGGCGLPFCNGELSYYTYGNGATVFCEGLGGITTQNSDADIFVALPGDTPGLAKLCGRKLRVTWNGVTKTVIVGDKCGGGCNHSNRLDLTYAAMAQWGNPEDLGLMKGATWSLV
ncbi:MAG: 60S ribosomal protein L30 [Watsoniomyces obsoletus]|nr:MAG: 60S ribosomal protein L30 [Watsoniomyces obsoletus]